MNTTRTAPVTQTKVEYIEAGMNILIQATVTRYAHAEREYWISPASADRLSRAVHGRYTCRWPLCGRTGWYANLYADDQIRNYYRKMAMQP